MKRTHTKILAIVLTGLLLLSLTGCGQGDGLLHSSSSKPTITYPDPTEAQMTAVLQAEQLPMRPVRWSNEKDRGVFAYDAQGRLTAYDYTVTDYTGKVTRYVEDFTYEPWENGIKMTARTAEILYGEPADWNRRYLDDYYVCYFDADGQCIRKEVYERNGGQFRCDEKHYYTYDEAGRLTEDRTTHTYVEKWEGYEYEQYYDTSVHYQWNADGRLAQFRQDYLDSRIVETYQRNEYGDIINMEYEKMEIDENGNVINAVSRPAKNMMMIRLPVLMTPPSIQLYDIDYAWEYQDRDGRLFHRTRYNMNGGIMDEMWFYYDESGTVNRVITRGMDMGTFLPFVRFCPWMLDGLYHEMFNGQITWEVVVKG